MKFTKTAHLGDKIYCMCISMTLINGQRTAYFLTITQFMNGTRLRQSITVSDQKHSTCKIHTIISNLGGKKRKKKKATQLWISSISSQKAFCIRDATSGEGQQEHVWFGVSAGCTWSLSDSPTRQPPVYLCWDKSVGPASAVPLSSLRGRNYLVGSMTPSHKLYHMHMYFVRLRQGLSR